MSNNKSPEFGSDNEEVENHKLLIKRISERSNQFYSTSKDCFCDECGGKINRNGKYFYCFGCDVYSLCAGCRSLCTSRHKHKNVDFVYELNEPPTSFITRNIEDSTMRITELMMKCFEYYSNRHFVGKRKDTKEDFQWLTYSDILQQVKRLVLGMTKLCLLEKGDLVLIQCEVRIEPIIIWFSCMYSGIGFVPLQSILSDENKMHIVRQTEGKAIFCLESEYDDIIELQKKCPALLHIITIPDSHGTEFGENVISFPNLISFGKEEEEKLRKPLLPVPLQPDDIICIIYTSGTTSAPKGIVFREDRWLVDFRMESRGTISVLPLVMLCMLPFSCVSGIYTVILSFVSGGRVGLLSESDFKNLFDDFRDLSPTVFVTVPRILKFVQLEYQRRVEKLILSSSLQRELAEEKVKCEMKNVFGDKLFRIDVGSAHCPVSLKEFIRGLTELPIYDVYGLSEMGTITSDYSVNEGIEVKIIDCPQLNYYTTDVPYSRGELLVKNPLKQRVEYFKGPSSVIDNKFDEDGYFHTGDIVEKREEGRIFTIDRINNIYKLSNGEFVSLENVEMVLEGSNFIDQIVLFPNPEKTALVGIASTIDVRNPEISEEEVLKDLILISGHKGLKPFEFPVSIRLVTKGFPLTETTKKNRKKIERKYTHLLKSMYSQINSFSSYETKGPGKNPSVFEFLGRLGIRVDSDMMERKISELGVKSFSAILLRSQIERARGIKFSYSGIMNLTVSKIQDLLQKSEEECEGEESDSLRNVELFVNLKKEQSKFNSFIISLTEPPQFSDQNLKNWITQPKTIFMTGITGFLGRRILDQLLKVYPCSKILGMTRTIPKTEFKNNNPNVIYFEGDLSLPFFGRKSQEEFDSFFLKKNDIDLVFHCGAHVNYFGDYEDLYAANVGSLYTLLGITRGVKPIVYISSLSVHEEYGVEVVDQKIPISRGYEGSKWVVDCLLQSLPTKNVLVIRPNYVLGDTVTGKCNLRGWWSCVIKACISVKCVPCSGTTLNVPANAIAVNYLADSICLMMKDFSLFQEKVAVDISMENVTVGEFLKYLVQLVEGMKEVSWKEWIQELENLVKIEVNHPINIFIEWLKENGKIGKSTFRGYNTPQKYTKTWRKVCLEDVKKYISFMQMQDD